MYASPPYLNDRLLIATVPLASPDVVKRPLIRYVAWMSVTPDDPPESGPAYAYEKDRSGRIDARSPPWRPNPMVRRTPFEQSTIAPVESSSTTCPVAFVSMQMPGPGCV